MNSIQQFRDVETIRQQRNLTKNQKKASSDTVEGVVVNNLVKNDESNIDEIYNSLIISKNIQYPSQLVHSQEIEKQNSALKRLSIVATGFFTLTTTATFLLAFAAKRKALCRLDNQQRALINAVPPLFTSIFNP